MIEKHIGGNVNLWSVRFDSLAEFERYIIDTPENKAFQFTRLASKATDMMTVGFTHSKDLREATDLLHNGWADKAEELTKRLRAVERDMSPVVKNQRVVSVAGFQPIVPLFLMGSPACMYGNKMQPVKQKVVTLVKSISYNASTSCEDWTNEGLKALAIVKKLEANGYRVNVDVIRGGYDPDSKKNGIVCRVRVKHANERLNVSKMAFCLCHPSMQRRLMFRFTEVYDKVTSGFPYTYGMTFVPSDFEPVLDKRKEYFIPAFIKGDVDRIRSVSDLEMMA